MVALAPRSTEIQPGSVQPVVALLAQRVAELASKALAGVQPEQLPSSWKEEAVAGLP